MVNFFFNHPNLLNRDIVLDYVSDSRADQHKKYYQFTKFQGLRQKSRHLHFNLANVPHYYMAWADKERELLPPDNS